MNDETYLKNKFEETNGELLNTYFEDMADLWREFDMEIITTNAFNEYFTQHIYFKIENFTYFADSSEVKHLKKGYK